MLICQAVHDESSCAGWQSRWFILENGILSYYKSFEEVEQGCKGSINVSECEISPNHTDNTRMDLIIPGEQVRKEDMYTFTQCVNVWVQVSVIARRQSSVT